MPTYVTRAELAAARQAIRQEIADAIADAKLAPAPPPLPPSVDLRPWISPIVPKQTIGSVGVKTTIGPGVYEDVLFKGEIRRESGDATFRRCILDGPHGLGDGATMLYLIGGHTTLDRIECRNSEGRSGIYLEGGTLTPIEVWVHHNGVGLGKLHQQLYVGGGEIVGGKGGLIEDGEDFGLSVYSPAGYKYPVSKVEWDGLHLRRCKRGPVAFTERVSDLHLINLLADGTGSDYGVYGYNIDGTNNSVAGRVWGAKLNVAGSGYDATNVVEAAP